MLNVEIFEAMRAEFEKIITPSTIYARIDRKCNNNLIINYYFYPNTNKLIIIIKDEYRSIRYTFIQSSDYQIDSSLIYYHHISDPNLHEVQIQDTREYLLKFYNILLMRKTVC